MAADGNEFSVEVSVSRGAVDERLRAEWNRDEGRRFFRGEKPVSFREAAAQAPAVFLAPEHRELLTGPPSVRRRFLDRLVFASRPGGGSDLVRYERALKERNALLWRARDRRTPETELETWTEEVVLAGTAVRRHRLVALREWLEIFHSLARAAGPEYSTISVGYVPGGGTEEDLRRELARLSSVERRRGHTMAGPHRDDLAWARNGKPLAACASAGEIHRAVALVKLAEWGTVERAAGESPLLAVDDFDAGLSPAWVEAFLTELPREGTVLLTTASEPSPWKRWATKVLEIREGRVGGRPRAIRAGTG